MLKERKAEVFVDRPHQQVSEQENFSPLQNRLMPFGPDVAASIITR
jgi:hypothetical protein